MPKSNAVRINVRARAVVLASSTDPGPDEIRYVWDPDRIITPIGGFPSVRIGKEQYCKTLSGWDAEVAYGDGSDRVFLFYCEDCFDPAVWAIVAQSWEDAYERFCEVQADLGHYLISDDDPDYSDDDGTLTGDGRRVDSSCFSSVGSAPFYVVSIVGVE